MDVDVDPAVLFVARRLRADLVRPHPSFRFEEGLARRLAPGAPGRPAVPLGRARPSRAVAGPREGPEHGVASTAWACTRLPSLTSKSPPAAADRGRSGFGSSRSGPCTSPGDTPAAPGRMGRPPAAHRARHSSGRRRRVLDGIFGVDVLMPVRLPFRPRRDAYPPDLWTKCPGCSEMLFNKQLDKTLRVCPNCGHHFRISGPHPYRAARGRRLVRGARRRSDSRWTPSASWT